MKTKYLITFAIASLLLVGGAMAVAFLAIDGKAMSNLVGATPDYHPTARWVAPGVDPNVTQFDVTQKAVKRDAIDPEVAAQQLVQNHYADLMPCYTAALEDEDVEGRLDIRVGVQPSGEIALVEVTASELEAPEMENCVVETARRWKLPPTGHEVMLKFDADFAFAYE